CRPLHRDNGSRTGPALSGERALGRREPDQEGRVRTRGPAPADVPGRDAGQDGEVRKPSGAPDERCPVAPAKLQLRLQRPRSGFQSDGRLVGLSRETGGEGGG
ncbi:MAG: hypothetical protein BJ554DRAFT_6173, partial [Olpidium bornovanus]